MRFKKERERLQKKCVIQIALAVLLSLCGLDSQPFSISFFLATLNFRLFFVDFIEENALRIGFGVCNSTLNCSNFRNALTNVMF